MNRKILLTAAFLGMISIILGAFGAHALKKILTVDQLSSFETGVKYQMYHALFLLFVGISKLSDKAKNVIFILVAIGTVLFSGSIYLLATNGHFVSFNFKAIGFVTPLGGLLLILAWFILFIKLLKHK